MKTTIALVIITLVSFSVFFVAANAVEKKDGEDSLVERVVSRYGEKLPQKEIVRLGEGTLASDIDTLVIESNSNAITFYPEEKEGKVEIFGALETTTSEIKKEGSKLIVKVETKAGINWNFKFDNESIPNSGVRVHLPKTVKHVELQASSGDIKVSSADVETLSIKTSSGDVRGENLKASSATIMSSSGDLKLNITAESKNITTSSGDIALEAKNCKELVALSASGDVTLSQNCEISNITTSSGDITIHEIIPAKSTTLLSRSGDVTIRYRNPSPSTKVSLLTRSGDLKMSQLESQITQKTDSSHFTLNKGESALNVTTASGDINLSILD